MIQEDIDLLQKKALRQSKTDKSLFGNDAAFVSMQKQFLESALETRK